MIPNEVEFVQSKNFAFKQGSSPKSLVNLAKLKNYHLVANTLTNLFFIHENIKDLVLEENWCCRLLTQVVFDNLVF